MVAKLPILLLLGGLLSLAAPARGGLVLEYSQNGRNYRPLQMLRSNQSAVDYYDYSAEGGHPAFETGFTTATTTLHWDARYRRLSLMHIAGRQQELWPWLPVGGMGTIALARIPSVAKFDLLDDAGECVHDRSRRRAEARMVFAGNTDGLVLGNLEGLEFHIKLKWITFAGLQHWRLADGDPERHGRFIALDPDRPLYLRTHVTGATKRPPPGEPPLPPVAVPEPATVLAAGLGGLLWTCRRRLRR